MSELTTGNTTGRWTVRRQRARHLAREYGLQVYKFADRYGLAVLALLSSAIIGWSVANSVSDYTQRGWELHIQQPTLGINIHFHHWYYGVPLGLIALALIEKAPRLSIFMFGLGLSLSTHSFVNERGIPSIFEGGETLRVPFEVYLPAVTMFAMLYAFFIIRREEWLARSREREELAMSYLVPNDHANELVGRLNDWAAATFTKRRRYFDRWTKVEYGYWRAMDRPMRGEWQMHYVLSPFDEFSHLLVIKMQHIPLIGRQGTLDEWLEEVHALLKPEARLLLQDDRVVSFEIAKPDAS